MPRFYFDIRHGEILTEDHVGRVLSGIKDAQRQAQYELGEMLRRVSGSAMRNVMTIEVKDEAGKRLFRAKLVFEIEPLS